MHKIIAVLVTALAVIMPLLTFASPAQADQATAQASFDSIADQAANKIQALHPHTYSGVRADEGWNSAYAAELMAHRDGSWSDPDVTAYLNKVYQAAVTKNGITGYGKGYSFDAWDRPSPNSADTIYTVTMTDHVGEPLLAGYDAGVVPASRLQQIADALWAMPRYNTGSGKPAAAGKCIAYSDSQYDQPAHTNANGSFWCAVNVNIGAAAFLQKLLDRGITPAGTSTSDVTTLIQQIVDFTLWVRNEGVGSNFPYAFRSIDGAVTSTTGNNPQDANHEAYTNESLQYLNGYYKDGFHAAAVGVQRLGNQVRNANHIPNTTGDQYNNDYTGLIENKGFDIVGRLRAASAVVLYDDGARNLLQEAQWWVNAANAGAVEGHANPYSWGQIGRWAARLAFNATAETELSRKVEFMSKPRVYNYPYSASGSASSLTSVKKGQKYTIWTDARFYDLSSNLQFITNIPIRLKLGLGNNTPTLFDTKSTGYEWYGSRFVYTVPSSTNATSVSFCSEVTEDQASTVSPNAGCRVVSITN